MHLFSRTLLSIYNESTKGSLREFQAAAIRLLRDCFHFDAVVLGASLYYPRPGMYIISSHIDGLPRAFLDDYIPLLSHDPMMQALLAGLEQPLAADLQFYYQNLKLAPLADFSRQYRLRRMMTFGDAPRPDTAQRWIMLFTDGQSGFTPPQQQRLADLWPHISQASAMCEARGLLVRKLVPPRAASALLNAGGQIAFADVRFVELLQLEWPELDISAIAQLVQEQLLQARIFRGKCIEIAMAPEPATVCQARPTTGIRIMTPRETLVARRFAAGLSHKEVARELGISPHTVRTQLMHVYAKLRLHDKGALASYLMAQGGAVPKSPPN
jgi:DNA-binding CsgD family transcriptional regulator